MALPVFTYIIGTVDRIQQSILSIQRGHRKPRFELSINSKAALSVIQIDCGIENPIYHSQGQEGVAYYVDTVGRTKKQIAEYIWNQLESFQLADQLGRKEFVDPFTGCENRKA